LKISQRFGETYLLRLPVPFVLISFFACCPTGKLEATCSSETSVYFQRTTRSYIP
jgi:hypothetical protein